ncbi:glycosyltransferase family 4 protein [Zunongwangia endophytica]|uniref:Glycosyltransferase family 4 protein n=1 Tax=Zunongwangia endophytica TaxID=1808945 RepID=A0ABV8HCA6_9FLAO|nr:glycosyltransferase family 4 protein [Zunongwangia endophytica]MDN3596250.1 glycosyltransferase family 4 protein [Zunongwangia endophytica]
MSLHGKHILIIVENLPVPFDRRVWQEATTLKTNGADVSIICPKMKGYTEDYELIDSIEIYRHPLPLEARGALGYLIEYGGAIYWEIKLARQIYKKKPFHVIHGCNPPDLIYLTAKIFKKKGVKYVFDHHDINPELYIAKYDKKDFFYRLMLYFEKKTFKHADASIATNESYKEIAIRRGGMREDNVQVVRSGPKLDRLKLQPPKLEYKKGRKYLIGYLGVIGEQEGIDLLLESVKQIVAKRNDVQVAIVGGGSDLDILKDLAVEMGLKNYVDFYGRVSDQLLVDILNTADVCVNPDKPTEMNNLSTMNKIMEYMALKKPIVQFNLKEGQFSAQEASLYAEDVTDFANKIEYLLDNKEVRSYMGDFGYNRVVNELSWDYESVKLISFYQRLLHIDT